MSSLWKQLVDLGEDEKKSESLAADDDINEMNAEQLRKKVASLRQTLMDKGTEYENLRVDSQTLRSEYDAYKQKVDGWQRQMREARENDRKMIEQLRAAGASGSTDEVFAKNMNESLAKYKEALREANEEKAKAYKKQREAEEQRAAIEASKKKEIEELYAKFDALKERKKRENDMSASPGPATTKEGGPSSLHLERLKAKLHQAESNVSTLKNKNKGLEEEVASLRSLLSQQSTSTGEDAGSGGESRSGADDSSDKVKALQMEIVSLRSDISDLQGQLQQEREEADQLRQLESQLREDLRRAEGNHSRKLEDLEWEGVETEKKLAEARLQLEGANARCATLENRLDAKETERSLQEKELRRTIRDLEDKVAHEEKARADAAREFQERESQLHAEVSRAVEQAARTNELVGEAEQHSQQTAEALEAQRHHYEDHINSLERQLRENDAVRHRLEAIIGDHKDEARNREDIIDQLRRELDDNSARITDLEAQQIFQQRTLDAREEELLMRERERGQLRQQLAEAESIVQKIRTEKLAVEEERLEHKRAIDKLEAKLAEANLVNSKSEAEAHTLERSLKEKQRALESLESRANTLERDLNEEKRLHGDTARQLEAQKQQHKTSSVSPTNEGGAGANKTPPSLSLPAPRHTSTIAATSDPIHAASASYTSSRGRTRYQPLPFPGEREAPSFTTTMKRLTWAQWKILIAAAVFFLVIVSLINSGSVTPMGKISDAESMHSLQEKYDQLMTSLETCRQSLASLRGGSSPPAAPTS